MTFRMRFPYIELVIKIHQRSLYAETTDDWRSVSACMYMFVVTYSTRKQLHNYLYLRLLNRLDFCSKKPSWFKKGWQSHFVDCFSIL